MHWGKKLIPYYVSMLLSSEAAGYFIGTILESGMHINYIVTSEES